MTLQELAVKYGVPATKGGKVVFTDVDGKEHDGTILGMAGDCLFLHVPTYRSSAGVATHPTDHVRYLTPGVVQGRVPRRRRPTEAPTASEKPPRRRQPPSKPPKRRQAPKPPRRRAPQG